MRRAAGRAGRAGLLLLLGAGPAVAHGIPRNVGEGLAASGGPLLLPLLALGLMAVMARRREFVLAGAAGLLAGLILAPWIGPNADLLALAAGFACAVLTATGLPLAGPGHMALAALTGTLAGAALTGGHDPRTLPAGGLAGLALGSLVALAGPFALAPLLSRWPGPLRIGLRVAASWVAAISALALSLTFAGPLP
ncbi:hypothetical protein [Rubellimicrobium arenae]|uniref:hypothetical protein n=1 Tax=Rubellimicrobium arenae TaxID=2817372 RepID=UPI001B306388|nr:hypothetical protein [Rubellimicrobium arenae]